MTVKHRDLSSVVGKATFKALNRLRRETDFRHQNQRGFPCIQHAGDGLKIDLRLTTASDTMKKDRLRIRRLLQCFDDRLITCVLLFRQRVLRILDEFFIRKGIALDSHFRADHEAFFDQHWNDLRGAREFFAQLTQRALAAIGLKHFQKPSLNGRAFAQLFHGCCVGHIDQRKMAV